MTVGAPESSISVGPAALRDMLAAIVDRDRILTRPIDRIAYASDASFYRLIPRAVVRTRTVEEVRALFRFSHEHRVPLTFRAAGTSLSGQAVTDGILVEVARYWRQVSVEDGGKKIRVQPGVIGGHVNAALRPYRAKMGPDPASINACMVGGILANNSSGMCCGVEQNAYHTLDSLTFVLPTGTVINTAAADADDLLRQREPRLARGLLDLRREIVDQPRLADRIRFKYRMKNTTGYSLNAFLDYDRPVKILEHLLIGSEGTLAFIAEAVLHTVPDLPVKYTGLLLFPDLYAACAAIVPLRDAGAKALELMDRASLRSVEDQPGIPPSIQGLPEGAAGLLAEFQEADERARPALEVQAREAVGGLRLTEPARFTHSPSEQALLWKIRQGLFPSVGAVRTQATTVIIEDVVFPVERLADGTVALTGLFEAHGYDNGIIFGHAKDGNLHFVITPALNEQAAVDQYARLKELVDPEGLLNPGVIINPDPKAHLADIKIMPVVEDEVDKCIECGFCESKCPSLDLTLTPRQRIAVRREMARLMDSRRDPALLAGLEADFPYMALDTCAVDGLCAAACPVAIDTGQLTKRFRRLRHSPAAHRIARRLAVHFALVERTLRIGLRVGHLVQRLFGAATMVAITRAIRAVVRWPFPLWSRDMPRAALTRRPATKRDGAQAVYFPSCISRVMGHPRRP